MYKDNERYIKSLLGTPGPFFPPADRYVDLHGLYSYITEKGCKVSDLSKDEVERFVIREFSIFPISAESVRADCISFSET